MQFHNAYPNVELSEQGLRTGDIYKGLLQNELDLGITFLPVELEDLEAIPLYKEELAFAVPKDDILAKESSVSLQFFNKTSSILLPDTYFLRQVVNEQCR